MSEYALVQAGFGAPQRQNRWKVAFRLILVIPLLVWYLLISIAAGFLVVIGWFCALVLGRLPNSFVGPLSEYIIFTTRLNSYLYLMNDSYPPFSVKKDFGVNLLIPNSNVRRLAVLFRFILLIPVFIVNSLVTTGVQAASIFIWLIVLVKGEMPLTLFGALAGVLRFQARFYAYDFMITSKYPGELFGDVSSAPSDPLATLEVDQLPSPPVTELPDHAAMDESVTEASTDESVALTAEPDTDGSSLSFTPGAPTGAPTEFDADESASVPGDSPRTARLVLSQGSKRVVLTFLILGVLATTAQTVLQIRARSNKTALTELTLSYNALSSEVLSARTQHTNCTLAASVCLHQYFTTTETDFNLFQFTLDGINFPSDARTDALHLKTATRKFVAILDEMKSGTSTQAEAKRLQSLGTTFDTDFQQVLSDLSSTL